MVKIDEEKCIGCGLCASICPEVFEMDGNSKAKVSGSGNPECVKESAESCPVDAIIL